MRNAIGLIAVLAMLAGPLVAHFGVVAPLVGFAMFALGGIVSILVAIVSIVQAIRGRGLTFGGALGIVASIAFIGAATAGRGAPRINDFTTDTSDPPAFEHAKTLPQNAGRDLSYPHDFAAIQHDCCADLHPAKLAVPPAEAYERALRTARAMPAWTITRADPAGPTIEAVATTKVFRFQDDIVIRVRPDGNGSVVDMRSKSRDGKGDIGANTARIRAYTSALDAAK